MFLDGALEIEGFWKVAGPDMNAEGRSSPERSDRRATRGGLHPGPSFFCVGGEIDPSPVALPDFRIQEPNGWGSRCCNWTLGIAGGAMIGDLDLIAASPWAAGQELIGGPCSCGSVRSDGGPGGGRIPIGGPRNEEPVTSGARERFITSLSDESPLLGENRGEEARRLPPPFCPTHRLP